MDLNQPLIIAFLILNLNVLLGYGQDDYILEGKITDEKGTPLPGAGIYIHELSRGSNADTDGNYLIRGLSGGTYHLHIRFLGYRSITQKVKMTADTVLNFTLKESAIEMNEVIVEAHGMKSSGREHAQDITVLQDESILEKSPSGLMEALDGVEGVNSINAGTGISKPVIRGLGFNRVVTATNGIKQQGQQWGTEHGLEIDPFNASSVEIIKGPASLIYGPQAMNGVININSAPIPQVNSLKGSFTLLGHSNSGLYGGSTFLEGNLKGWFFQSRLSGKKYGDFSVPADHFKYEGEQYPLFGNRLSNTAGEQWNYNSTLGINKRWGVAKLFYSDFKQKAGFYAGIHGHPGEGEFIDDPDVYNIQYPFQDIRHQKVGYEMNIMAGDHWLELDGSYQRNLRTEREEQHHEHDDDDEEEGEIMESALSDTALLMNMETYGVNARFHHEINTELSNVYGISSSKSNNITGGFSFLIPDFERFNTGIYSLFKYRPDNLLTFSGGIRYDMGYVDVRGYEKPIFNHSDEIIAFDTLVTPFKRDFYSFSGSIGISWSVNEFLLFKTNLGSGFRFPSIPELSSNGLHHGAFRFEKGNKNLALERNYSLDMGLVWNPRNIFVKLTPFFNLYENFIYLAPTMEVIEGEEGGRLYRYRQDNAINTGAELLIDFHPADHLHIALRSEFVRNYIPEKKGSLPMTPPARISLQPGYEFKSFWILETPKLEIDPTYVFGQYYTAEGEDPTPSFLLVNARASVKIKTGKTPMIFIFGVNNLLDNKYLNHLSLFKPYNIPERGRNFALTLKVPFTLAEK